MIFLLDMLILSNLEFIMKYKHSKQIKELKITRRILVNVGYHWFAYSPELSFNHEYAWIKRKDIYYNI